MVIGDLDSQLVQLPVTIATGSSSSPVVDCTGFDLLAIQIAAAFTGTNLRMLQGPTGSLVLVCSDVAGVENCNYSGFSLNSILYPSQTKDLRAIELIRFIQLQSLSAGAPINQTAPANFTLYLIPKKARKP